VILLVSSSAKAARINPPRAAFFCAASSGKIVIPHPWSALDPAGLSQQGDGTFAGCDAKF
jgi:hypothetical protein